MVRADVGGTREDPIKLLVLSVLKSSNKRHVSA